MRRTTWWPVRTASRTTSRVLGASVALALGFTGGPLHAGQSDPVALRAPFEAALARWRSATGEAASRAVLQELLDLDYLVGETLRDQDTRLSEQDRSALRDAIVRSADRLLRTAASGADAAWERVGPERQDRDRTVLTYRIPGSDGGKTLTVQVVDQAGGQWKIRDLRVGAESLERSYTDTARNLLKDYSFPYMLAAVTASDTVVLEDFEEGPLDSLPPGWTWKDSDDKKVKPYAVRQGTGPDESRYLAATDEGQSVILGKDVSWNLEQYPYISFRLRVHKIPVGGDERDDKKVDSAAGLYFIYRKRLGLIPESVKYVWSSTLPVGTAVLRHGTGRPWMVAIGSGTDHLGEWRTYVFDLRQAYQDTFGKNPPGKMVGIGILSDANSTGSQAFADYDDIRAVRRVDGPVGSGVLQIVKPVR